MIANPGHGIYTIMFPQLLLMEVSNHEHSQVRDTWLGWKGLPCSTMCTGCKEKHFYSLPFRQAEASSYYSQDVISTSPKNFLTGRINFTLFFCYNKNSNSSKNITCPSGKLKTEFTSPIAKSISPGLNQSLLSLHASCRSAWTREQMIQENPTC